MNADIHTLTGAYALDALSDVERVAFEDHLAQCAACNKEVAELRETAARLGSAVATPPPDRVKAQVLGEIRRTRQLPPDEGPIIPIRGRRWPLRVATLAAAAGIVAAAALSIEVIRTNDELSRAEQQLNEQRSAHGELAEVLMAPDARTIAGTDNGLRGTVIVSESMRKVAFVPSELPPPGAGKTYQLWLIGPTGASSAGLLEHAPVVADATGDARQVGITVEPAGGSEQPTTEPLLVLALRR